MSGDGSAKAVQIRRQLERLARTEGLPLDRLIQDFAVERFLFRLASSPWADRFIMKGAALLRLWGGPAVRPTRDIDFCGRIDASPEAVTGAIRQCLAAEVADDGLVFSPEVESDVIVVDGRYPGVRVVLRAELAGARVRLQLDVGIGDAVVPEPAWVDYPTLLDLPCPRILAYAPATSVAEKLHAMVSWGLANSRMKDYYDLWFLAITLDFDGLELVAALTSTFRQRDTALPAGLPVGLTQSFWDDADADRRWRAFVSHLRGDSIPSLRDAIEVIARFVGPVMAAGAAAQQFKYGWARGGPWLPRDAPK